ncbi:MAG TPA: hypothetical protein VLY24_11485 [Bryobacteraceae bacterium]|nr:hypothetical protein [Bryobacteraceae bacterium]
MTLDERLNALTQTGELLSSMDRDNEKRMGQMMDAISRLANVAVAHEERLDEHERRLDDLR